MNDDKLQAINKIFNNDNIRTVWDKEEEKYYISVVAIIGIIADTKDGKKILEQVKTKT